jgi:hypothetical protein
MSQEWTESHKSSVWNHDHHLKPCCDHQDDWRYSFEFDVWTWYGRWQNIKSWESTFVKMISILTTSPPIQMTSNMNLTWNTWNRSMVRRMIMMKKQRQLEDHSDSDKRRFVGRSNKIQICFNDIYGDHLHNWNWYSIAWLDLAEPWRPESFNCSSD